MTSDADYGPAIAALLDPPRKMTLGGGQPNEAARASLDVPTSSLFGQPVRNAEMAAGCHAALWLRHDFLPEAHRLSQKIGSLEGSYWHAIMHRREGDFGNAKYWFRKVGDHALFPRLLAATQDAVADSGTHGKQGKGLAGSAWNAFNFVDCCEVESEFLMWNVFGKVTLRH